MAKPGSKRRSGKAKPKTRARTTARRRTAAKPKRRTAKRR
jgi:hypothetical protein